MDTRISVLMPVRNGGPFLKPAVRSTLYAMGRRDELIVVDDGSTDDTASTLEAAARKDKRVRILSHSHAVGVALSLNEALVVSQGAYIARMDADDICLPWRFRAQIKQLGRADLVFSSAILINHRSRIVGTTLPVTLGAGAARQSLLIGNFFIHPTLLTLRETLNSLGGWKPTPAEDYDLWLRACASDLRLSQSWMPTLAYRQHAAQVTKTWTVELLDATIAASYGSLLPGELRQPASLVAELASSALSRVRNDVSAVRSWEQLENYLSSATSSLSPLERLQLFLRRLKVSRSIDPNLAASAQG